MEIATVSKLRKVEYAAVDFTAGLSDLLVVVRKPDGSTITPAVTGQGGGIYTFSYTPDVTGLWQEKITSAVNGDVAYRNVNVEAYDVSDVKAQTASIETKVDTVDGKVDAVDGKVTTVDGKVDAVGAQVTAVDGKVDAIQATADSIEGKVDAISTSVKTGGYFL